MLKILAMTALFALTVAGLVIGCSSSTSSDACANHNDSRCPKTYTTSLANQPCAPVGLACTYIGSGSGSSPPGCPGAAGLFCYTDGGVTDAGSGVWGFSQ